MASAKIATLVIRTLAKPISNQIKQQVKQHERFRTLCVDLAQYMYRTEVKLRQNILGEPAAKHIRPLSEAKAIENGANALAEGFLFSVAAALIIAETWRSSRNASKRRDSVDDQLEDLGTRLGQLSGRVEELTRRWEDEREVERERYNDLARILEKVIENGLHDQSRDGNDRPTQLPRFKPPPPGDGVGETSQTGLQSTTLALLSSSKASHALPTPEMSTSHTTSSPPAKPPSSSPTSSS